MKNVLQLAALLLITAGSSEAATIAPHRAIYDLALLKVSDGASLSSAQGRLAFEIQGSSCEGWTVSFRMATNYRPMDGQTNLIDTQSTSYEDAEGLEFRHQNKELINGEVKEEARIKMTRTSTDAEGQGEITSKSNEAFTVPAGAALPMQHQFKLMVLGEAGGGRDSSIVYDGSDASKTYRAISFIGKSKPPGSISRDRGNPQATALSTLAAWPMTISYFPDGKAEETPDYQVTFDMYENGVATGLVLDYGAFSLSGTLSSLEMLTATPCE